VKIAFIIDNLRREGTQLALVKLVSGLAQRGYAQRVYCLNNAHATIVQALEEHGAQVHVYGKAQIFSGIGLLHLARDLRTWQPHIVQTQLFVSDCVGRTLAPLAGVSKVVSQIQTRNIDKHLWQLWLDNLTVRYVRWVVFNSRAAIPFALTHEGVHPDQVVYIPDGVVQHDVNPFQARQQVQHELGLSPDQPLIGMVGRLFPQKGYPYLLEAMAKVVQAFPSVVLLIIGDGPERAALQHKVAALGLDQHVHFLGVRNDVPVLLAALDVYVHSSLFEGTPNAVREAMAAGKPIVATSVDGTREILADRQTGWLVMPGDAPALAQQLIYALGHLEESRLFGAAAKQASQSFSVDAMVAAYDALYTRSFENA
jgi:glycosyltransferase involved in cell wall biosynthesis